MPRFDTTYPSTHTSLELYSLVMDVHSYPDFLPWVSDLRILETTSTGYKAEVAVRFKGYSESYRCTIAGTPPTNTKPGTVIVGLIDGPLDHLDNRWVFTPDANNHCQVQFFIDFAFKRGFLSFVMDQLFLKAQKTLVEAFEQEANRRYGITIDATQ